MTNPKEALEWYERKRVEARAMEDRDCNNCKHQKPDGCSRWDCEYEPVMSDLIKKSDAIKALYKYNFVSKNVIEREINAIPSAEPQWIPVSERLPENNGCMLVTIDDAIEFGKYEDGEWSIWVCEHWDEWDAKGVTAWMPLPEPYREDGEA